MTEFALVLPVLALFLFGVAQFGILFNNYVTLTDAVRSGARKAAVSRLEAAPEAVAEAAVRGSAKNLDEPCKPNSGLCVSVVATAWKHGEDVTVEATYPYKVDLMGLTLTEGRLKSTTTERVE